MDRSLADCVLLFAVPLTREDFDRAGAGDALGDYGAKFSERIGGPDLLWHEQFARIAASGTALADHAAARGAAVYHRARLADVTAASRGARLLILFAHMWSAVYAPRHLIDPSAIRARFDCASPFARWLQPEPDEDAASVARTLNRLVGHDALTALLPVELQPAARASPPIGRALHRDLLDEWLAGLVAPGNRVELYDGSHAPGRFAAAIDPAFAGEMDLATCNSTVLTLAIELRFDLAIRLASRITLTVPHPELHLAHEALRADAGGCASYLHHRTAAARRLRAIAD